MSDDSKYSKDSGDTDLVITPGGARPRSMVHEVQTGQVVRGEEGGSTALVTPQPARVRQLGSAVAPVQQPAFTGEEIVVTPGGPRARRLLQPVQPGELVHFAAQQARILNSFTGEVARVIEHPVAAHSVSRDAPALGTGWIADCAWSNNTGTPISSFRSSWRVPPAPYTRHGQLIYLFNGINPVNTSAAILQPVLQWGTSPDGGGEFWSVASWYVLADGTAYYTSPVVQVNEGDLLTGVMNLTGQQNGLFSYTAEFEGIAGTRLTVQNIVQLVWCNETLEAYSVEQWSDYPNTRSTAFAAISIRTGNTTPALAWAAQNRVTDCGQHAVVVDNANPGGEVDIFYRTEALRAPVPAVVTSLTRFRDHIDLFVTDVGGGVQSTFWDASSGWFWTWFSLRDSNFWDGFTIPPGGPITPLCRFQNHIDLFTVGRDGAIYSTFWDANGGWFNRWFRLADTNFGDSFTVEPGSQVTAVSRYSDHIDLFVTGRDGAIYSTFWDANGGWFNRWFRLADTNFWDQFTVPPRSTVSALSRYPNHLDLFVSGRDGAIYSTFWDANGGWFNQWFRLGDANFWDGFTVDPGTPVSALTRFPDHIDLFVVGRDGGVYSTFWDANGGWFNHWFRLGDTNFWDNFTVPPGSFVSNLSRYRDHIDLFTVGRDGAIYSTFWDANGGWFNRWFRLGDANFWDGFTVPPGSLISPMTRFQDHIDLFVAGRDGGIYSTFWDANSGWFNHWFSL
jgi:hypothetical protein